MNSDSWRTRIYHLWTSIGVPDFLGLIGVDFKLNFSRVISESTVFEDPYRNSKWEIIPHSTIPFGVLHCYPREIESSKVVWEEWFLLNSEIHHHILSNHPFDDEQGVWMADPDDSDHPVEVLGQSWHYQNSKDLRPSLLVPKEHQAS